MPSDYQGILDDVEIEEEPGSFMPVLTPEMSDWLFDASVSLGNAFGGGRIKGKTYRTIQKIVNAVALFTPSDIVLSDGRQRATFSYRQMAAAIGLSPKSTKTVQQVLRVLRLETESTDAATYREAYELLYEERGGRPLLSFHFKSNSRKLASAWNLCGIRPRACALVERSTVAQREPYPTVPQTRPTVVTGEETVAKSASTVVDPVDIDPTTITGRSPDLNAANEAATSDLGARHRPNAEGTVVDSSESDGPVATTLNTSSLITHSSEDPEGWFSRLTHLFQYPPGRREADTREAFNRLMGMGYSPRALYDGAAAYVTRTPKSEQMRFPLKFLEDVSLVRSWCKAPPRTLDPTKLCKVESHWAYPFKAGLEFVVCPPTATMEEAFDAVRRMVAEYGREP